MKFLAFVALMTISASTFADQCQVLSSTQTKRALNFIKKNATVLVECEPCNTTGKVQTVMSVGTKKIGDGKSIMINGQEVDMAYTFIAVGYGRFFNMAKLIGGCDNVTGVSEALYFGTPRD